MTKAGRIIAALATAALAYDPKPASAYVGPLVTCVPSVGTPATVTFSPGLTCTEAMNRFSADIPMDNCDTTVPYETWSLWQSIGYGSRIPAYIADNIAKASVRIKGSMFGSCRFTDGNQTATSVPARAAGKLYLYDSAGTRIPGGYGNFFAQVHGIMSLDEYSHNVFGIMTKGFGVGAKINFKLWYDLWEAGNENLVNANTQEAGSCITFVTAPEKLLYLQADATSYLEIYFGSEQDCTGADTPFRCCTGPGTGPTCQGL